MFLSSKINLSSNIWFWPQQFHYHRHIRWGDAKAFTGRRMHFTTRILLNSVNNMLCSVINRVSVRLFYSTRISDTDSAPNSDIRTLSCNENCKVEIQRIRWWKAATFLLPFLFTVHQMLVVGKYLHCIRTSTCWMLNSLFCFPTCIFHWPLFSLLCNSWKYPITAEHRLVMFFTAHSHVKWKKPLRSITTRGVESMRARKPPAWGWVVKIDEFTWIADNAFECTMHASYCRFNSQQPWTKFLFYA